MFGFGVGSWGVVWWLVTVWVGIVVLGFVVVCLGGYAWLLVMLVGRVCGCHIIWWFGCWFGSFALVGFVWYVWALLLCLGLAGVVAWV